MRKIRYNIAGNKKIDYMKFGLLSSVVVVISLLFIMLGIGNLWSSDQRVQEQKKTAEKNEKKLGELEKKIEKNKKDIKWKKSEWQKQVSFANSLIAGKNFLVVEKLEILEKQLPVGAFITDVVLDKKNPLKLQISIAAESLQRLIETYKNFSNYKLVIKNETELEGLLKANLILNLKKKK